MHITYACMVACIYIYVHMDATCVYILVIHIDRYVLSREIDRRREIERDIYVCTAHCSLLELTKCVIEPSTRPRVTCNSETIACHCLPGYLHVTSFFLVTRIRELDKGR